MCLLRTTIFCLATLLIGRAAAQGPPPGVTDAAVRERVGQLVDAIIRQQARDGSWTYRNEYSVGATALALLALKNAGVANDHPAIQRGVEFIVDHEDKRTYSEGLVPCALELIDPVRYRPRIVQAVRFLESAQLKGGDWTYVNQENRANGDHSNTQFAALGLAAAERCGVPLPQRVREKAVEHWRKFQTPEGGWGYNGPQSPMFSMTCAGIASLQLLGEEYSRKRTCCGDTAYDQGLGKGLKWLEAALRSGQRALPGGENSNYALYALERVGILMNVKEFGGTDWYRWGATVLLGQNPNGSLAGQCFALLFLAKGSAPIAIAKWQWDGDWNRQRLDVQHWVEAVGGQLNRRFDWLPSGLGALDAPAAKASLIYVGGRLPFKVNDQEIAFLRAFLDAGGTLVAEAHCESHEFADSFRQTMMQRLYPELNPRWVPLTRRHPVCSSKFPLPVSDVGALELRCECRELRVLFLERGISCALNGDDDSRADRPRAFKVATNLLAWALDRRDASKKLDGERLIAAAPAETLTADQLRRAAAADSRRFTQPFGRLKHRGEWTAAATFFPHLADLMKPFDALPAFDGEVYVAPASEDLYQAAVLLVTGYRAPALAEDELLNLRAYVQHGGFVLAAAACSSPDFDEGFRALVRLAFPNDKLEPVPRDDPLWRHLFELAERPAAVTPAYRERFGDGWAPLLGLRREGRWVLVYSPADWVSDIAQGLHESVPGYKREAGFSLIANLLHYAFTP